MHATNTFPVDRHSQYRHYPTTIRSIASGIIIEVEKNHIRYSHKLSIISKQSRLMHKELRYQVKTHAISDMAREEKKILQFLPPFFFIKQNAIWR